jgi:hypothetical protein
MKILPTALELKILSETRVDNSFEEKGYTFDFELMRKLYFRKK